MWAVSTSSNSSHSRRTEAVETLLWGVFDVNQMDVGSCFLVFFISTKQRRCGGRVGTDSHPLAVAAQGSNCTMGNNRSARGDPSLGDETLLYHQKQGRVGARGSITVFGLAILGQLGQGE